MKTDTIETVAAREANRAAVTAATAATAATRLGASSGGEGRKVTPASSTGVTVGLITLPPIESAPSFAKATDVTVADDDKASTTSSQAHWLNELLSGAEPQPHRGVAPAPLRLETAALERKSSAASGF